MTNRCHSPSAAGAIRAGRPLGFVAVLAFAVLVSPGCREHLSSKPCWFAMSYLSPTATGYHRVEIDSTLLKYTYYEKPETLVWVVQAPCYADSDLRTLTASLSQADLDELARAVNRSGFLRLPDTSGNWHGGPGPIVSAEISVGRCCGRKTKVYVNGPMPQALEDVKAALAGLVQAKFGRTFALTANLPAWPSQMVLRSPAFTDGHPIPRTYAGDGKSISPPLEWSDVPAGTKSFALTCADLDQERNRPLNWVVYAIPESTRSLPESTGDWSPENKHKLPGAGYYGMAPPPGRTHRFRFTLYALNFQPEFTSPVVDVEMLEAAIAGHVLARANLVGTYYVDPGFGGRWQ
jgi:Raf kinase inhibitor-like YbhB/YbcL family protein